MKLIEYYLQKQEEARKQIEAGAYRPEQLFMLQELNYRICVIETMRDFCRSAPVTTDVRQLCTHYRVVDTYIRFLMSERQVGSKTDEDGQKKRDTALSAFTKVVQDYQRRFGSFQATTPDQYKKVIENTINTVLPVWAQYRATYFCL